jgi:hypothetical protein
MPVLNGSMPRDRNARTAAPISPNTAPEAPTVGWSQLMTSTRNDPPSSDMK